MTDAEHPNWFDADDDEQVATAYGERPRALQEIDLSAADWFDDLGIEDGVEIDGRATAVVSTATDSATATTRRATPDDVTIEGTQSTSVAEEHEDPETTAADIDDAKATAAAAAERDTADTAAEASAGDQQPADDSTAAERDDEATADEPTAASQASTADTTTDDSAEDDGGLVAWIKSLFGLD